MCARRSVRTRGKACTALCLSSMIRWIGPRFNRLRASITGPCRKACAPACRTFFSNLGDVPVMANYLLQGQWAFSAESLMRIAINTLFGVGGLFDVAQEVGLPKRRTDFGLTFGRYGIPAGPYLVL